MIFFLKRVLISSLDYSNIELYDLESTDKESLQHGQNSAPRNIHVLQKCDHTLHVLDDIRWLSLKQRVQCIKFLLTYKLNGSTLHYHDEILLVYFIGRPLKSQHKHLLQKQKHYLGDSGRTSVMFL